MFNIIEKTYQQPDKHKTSFGVILTNPEGLEHGTYVWDRKPDEAEVLKMKDALKQSASNGKRGCFFLDENLPYKNREMNANPIP